jgi:alkylation response protein AidB-like acyl-CoA dehydrogenase
VADAGPTSPSVAGRDAPIGIGPAAGFALPSEITALVKADPGETGPALALAASGAAAGRLGAGRTVGAWDLAAGAGLAATVAYTTERVVFGKAVAHHQANSFDLAVASARLHGAGLARRDAAARFDADDPDAGFWATQAWIETMEAAAAATDHGIQLLGGHGFLMDHLAEKRFREVRMLALLWGGRDSAEANGAGAVLDVEDPIFTGPGRR